MSKIAIENIKEFKMKKFSTDIYLRTAYEQAAAYGDIVDNLPDDKAKNEIKNLKAEIIEILN